MHADDIAFHAGDFRDLHHSANSAGEAGHLHDDLQRRRDLPPNDPKRQIQAGQAAHHLQPAHRIACIVGMDRRHASFVPRIHGLQHIEGFAAAAFADDDAIRPHAQAHCVPGRGC